jgi:hypothetical protein
MKCPGCGHENTDKVGFGTVCGNCLAWLHTCSCCRLYNTESGRCRSRTTEYAGPPDLRNFCEEFAPVAEKSEQVFDTDAASRFDRLFDSGKHTG